MLIVIIIIHTLDDDDDDDNNKLHIALHMLHIKSHYMIIMWSLSLFVLNKTDSFAVLFVLFPFFWLVGSFVRSFSLVSVFRCCLVCISFASYAMNKFTTSFSSSSSHSKLSSALPVSLCLSFLLVGSHFKHQTIFQRCFCNLEYFIMHTFCVFRVFAILFIFYFFHFCLLFLLRCCYRLNAFMLYIRIGAVAAAAAPPFPLLPPTPVTAIAAIATILPIAVESKSISANLLNE